MEQLIFVSGIGTDVGKTVVSAVLTEALQADYWKPVQAGNSDIPEGHTVRNLITNTKSVVHPEKFLFSQPVSPHLAAKMDGVEICVADFELPRTANKTLLVEGAGGLLVPLNHRETILDLIKSLRAKVVLVSANYLGSINHTLMSAYLLQHEKIEVLGIIFSGVYHEPSETVIQSQSGLRVLGRVEYMPELSKEAVAAEAQKFKHLLT
jgi:dethiobiotin synthetase